MNATVTASIVGHIWKFRSSLRSFLRWADLINWIYVYVSTSLFRSELAYLDRNFWFDATWLSNLLTHKGVLMISLFCLYWTCLAKFLIKTRSCFWVLWRHHYTFLWAKLRNVVLRCSWSIHLSKIRISPSGHGSSQIDASLDRASRFLSN